MRLNVQGVPTGIAASLLRSIVPDTESEKRAACADVAASAQIRAAGIATARNIVPKVVPSQWALRGIRQGAANRADQCGLPDLAATVGGTGRRSVTDR